MADEITKSDKKILIVFIPMIIILILFFNYELYGESILKEFNTVTKSSKETMQEHIKEELNKTYNNSVVDVTLVKATDHIYNGYVTLNNNSKITIEVTADEDHYMWQLKP